MFVCVVVAVCVFVCLCDDLFVKLCVNSRVMVSSVWLCSSVRSFVCLVSLLV